MEKILVFKAVNIDSETNKLEIKCQSIRIKRGKGTVIVIKNLLITSNLYPAIYETRIGAQITLKGVNEYEDNRIVVFNDKLKVFNALNNINNSDEQILSI